MPDNGLLLITAFVAFVVAVAVYVWYALALSRVFPMLGSPAWKAAVPIVNEAEILHLGGFPRWTVVAVFVPVISVFGLVLHAIAAHRLGRRLGWGSGATVLAVLLPPVWASVLAWGRPSGDVPAAPETEAWRRDPAQFAETAPVPVITGPLVNGPAAPSGSPEPAPLAAPEPAPPLAPALPPAPAPVLATSAPAPAPLPIVVPAPVTAPAPPLPPTGIQAPPWAAPPSAPAPTAPASAEPVITPPRTGTSASDAPAVPGVVADPRAAGSRFAPPGSVAVPAAADPDPDSALDPAESAAFLEDDEGETVVVDRRPAVAWELILDEGPSYAITATSVVLGRRPTGVDPALQYLAVADTSRTLSKVHARLDRVGDDWRIIDLGSTNGVLVLEEGGAETVVSAGADAVLAGRRFVLGRVGMRLHRTGAGS